VVAANHGRQFGAGPIDHVVRIRPIIAEIAAGNGAIELATRVFEDRVQSLPVAVNVAEYEISQDQARRRRSSAISAGAPSRIGMPMVPMPLVTKQVA